jgi:hypothetical protein
MPVLVLLVFGLFGVAVVAGLAIYGDRTIRRIVLFSFLVATALMVWWWSLGETPDITSDTGATTTVAPDTLRRPGPCPAPARQGPSHGRQTRPDSPNRPRRQRGLTAPVRSEATHRASEPGPGGCRHPRRRGGATAVGVSLRTIRASSAWDGLLRAVSGPGAAQGHRA